MKKQGARSAADLSSATFDLKLKPPRKLSSAEQAIWNRVMKSGIRFTEADADLIAIYCSAAVAYASAEDPGERDKAGKLALSYARALRLTPQSRYDAQKAARAANNGIEAAAGEDDPLLRGVPCHN